MIQDHGSRMDKEEAETMHPFVNAKDNICGEGQHITSFLLPVLLFLEWDTVKNSSGSDAIIVYEMGGAYLLTLVILFIQFIRMKTWKMVRTEQAVIYHSIAGKREITFEELKKAADKVPVAQNDKGYCFATEGQQIIIPTIDLVPNGRRFAMQVATEARIIIPQFKDSSTRRNLRAISYLTAILALVLGNIYWLAPDRQRAVGILAFQYFRFSWHWDCL